MRFVVVFVTGIAVGYTLHNRKDQSIATIAGDVSQFVKQRTSDVKRFTGSN